MMEQVVKCGNCGHDNPAGYRFCGMCGRAIPEPTPPPSRAEDPAEQRWEDLQDFQMPNFRRAPLHDLPPRTEIPDPPAPSEASISGPSFLGIGDQPSTPEFTYLLDDEPSRGPGRVLVALLILAALAGTGWWQLKRHGGREWLYSVLRNPKAMTQSGRSQDGVPPDRLDRSQAALAENTNNPNASKEADLQVKDGTLVAKDGQPIETKPIETKNANSQTPPADSSNSPATTSGDNQPGTDHEQSADHQAATEPSAAAPTDHVNAEESVRKQNPAPTEASSKQPGERNEAAVRKQHSAESVKPSPRSGAEQANSADDSDVRVAEKYLYGQGVPQDCGRALNLLKPAAEASNSKARSLLGTMYATGHCVPRDLPSSYRWFALALREEPNNRWVSRDLQSIWNQMSDSEKQTAMRMTR